MPIDLGPEYDNSDNPFNLPDAFITLLKQQGWRYFQFRKHGKETNADVLRIQLERKDGRVFAHYEIPYSQYRQDYNRYEADRNGWIVDYIENALEVHK